MPIAIDKIDVHYPRPTLVRKEWISLDGEWQFAFDDADRGLREEWFTQELPLRIQVPFCYQSRRSGIGEASKHACVWYRRKLTLPEAWAGKRILLHFGAVDYACTVFLNRMAVQEHTGGHVPFSVDITDFLVLGVNIVCLRVTDETKRDQPVGKQCPGERIDRCWYTPTTGIWRSVWLEPVPGAFIRGLTLIPNRETRTLAMKFDLGGDVAESELSVRVTYEGSLVAECAARCTDRAMELSLSIPHQDYVDDTDCWTPVRPALFGLTACLKKEDAEPDRIESYFGMRDVATREGMVLLNGRPLYQKLVLDQGYWRDTLLTPPDGDALFSDLLAIKRMGFNGVRMHQKIEDSRFYHFADVIGLVVWAEMPSCYVFTEAAMRRTINEWTDAVSLLRNHPSILVWVPLNESWGVRGILRNPAQQQYARALYSLTKALDPTRLVSTNDGWEQVDSDLCSIHDYFSNADSFERRYADLDNLLLGHAEGRMLYAEGFAYGGAPVILSEYGGVSFCSEHVEGAWGYNESAADSQAYLQAIASMTRSVRMHPRIQGFCYTQLTDVMQEANGLMDMDHRLKVSPEALERIFCDMDEKLLSGYADV